MAKRKRRQKNKFIEAPFVIKQVETVSGSQRTIEVDISDFGQFWPYALKLFYNGWLDWGEKDGGFGYLDGPAHLEYVASTKKVRDDVIAAGRVLEGAFVELEEAIKKDLRLDPPENKDEMIVLLVLMIRAQEMAGGSND